MSINYPINFTVDKSGLKKATSSLKKFGATATRIGASAGAAIGGAAAFSVKQFADFDQALNQSIAIMGNVSDALRDDMANAAKEVAKSTTFSAEQAAESFFFLASAGLDAEQSVAAMPQVAKFAQAGMFDMATATDLATDAQSALGLTSDDTAENLENLTRVTDVFVKANTLANTSVEQLATAFTSKAGTALKTVGKDVEEGAAALAVFADQGIKGERAGTLLTNTIFGLTDRVEAVPEKFDALGISIFDAEGNMRNFSEVSEQFTAVLGTMTTEQQVATLSQLGFTKQSREGILALVGNSEALTEYEGKLRAAGGTAGEVADNQLETFNAKMDILKSNVEVAAIEIGEQLIPHVSEFVDNLVPLIDEHLPTVIQFFEDMATNIGNVAEQIQPHIENLLPNLQTAFENLEEPLDEVSTFFRTIGEELLETIENIITDENFKQGLTDLGDNLGHAASEATRFVESDLGQSLQFLVQEFVVRGINGLASAVGFLADRMENFNDAAENFSVGNVVQGLRDIDNLLQNLFLPRSLKNFFGIRPTSTSGDFKGQRFDFADGGIVKARPGGIIGRLGEAGRDEAVIPLDRAGNLTYGGGSTNIDITVNAGVGTDPVSVGREVVNAIKRYESTNGKVFASA